MRIAIATDQDFVSQHFGCAPAFTIVELEEGRIRSTFIIPNPGCQHAFWADLFCRDSIKHLIAGAMGDNAQPGALPGAARTPGGGSGQKTE